MKSKDQRNVGMQTSVDSRNYVSPAILSHHQLEKDEYNRLFYTPHTVTLLLLVVIILNVCSYTLIPKWEWDYQGTDPKLPIKL